jgi:hypothetical protein
MGKKLDLLGHRFGRLIVIQEIGPSKGRSILWKCRCDCGQEKVILGNNLRGGYSKSCGCLQKEVAIETRIKLRTFHGEAAKNALIRNYKRDAETRNIDFELTDEEISNLFKGCCHYCNTPPSQTYKGHYWSAFTYNGIDRVDSRYGYFLDNVVSCCRICNNAKSTLSKQEFLDWIKRVYEHTYNSRP